MRKNLKLINELLLLWTDNRNFKYIRKDIRNSNIDGLKEIRYNSSHENREKLDELNRINNYRGTFFQNTNVR